MSTHQTLDLVQSMNDAIKSICAAMRQQNEVLRDLMLEQAELRNTLASLTGVSPDEGRQTQQAAVAEQVEELRRLWDRSPEL